MGENYRIFFGRGESNLYYSFDRSVWVRFAPSPRNNSFGGSARLERKERNMQRSPVPDHTCTLVDGNLGIEFPATENSFDGGWGRMIALRFWIGGGKPIQEKHSQKKHDKTDITLAGG